MTNKEFVPPTIPTDVLESLSKGGHAWGAQDYVAAKQYANAALESAKRHGSVHGELGALHLLANIAFNQCEDATSRELHERIKAKSLAINFWEGAASSLTNLALLDIVAGDILAARNKYQQAIGLYENAGNAALVEVVRSILSKEKIETVLDGIPRIAATQTNQMLSL